MPMIRETIVTTADAAGRVHIAPLGIIADDAAEGRGWIIAPFRPSTTLDNLRAVPFAVANYTDDVRVFAGCLTGRHDWPTTSSTHVPVPRLHGALAHAELAVSACNRGRAAPALSLPGGAPGDRMRAFAGFNRAQAAVVEAAILVSRLHLLPRQKIEQELAYLEIAVTKTAGEAELTAWNWLQQKVRGYYGDENTR